MTRPGPGLWVLLVERRNAGDDHRLEQAGQRLNGGLRSRHGQQTRVPVIVRRRRFQPVVIFRQALPLEGLDRQVRVGLRVDSRRQVQPVA